MTDSPEPNRSDSAEDLPEPATRRRRRWTVSLIWVVPLLAALIALSLVMMAWLSAGPDITITFQDAQGLTAGKTEVKYKNVVIGKVRNIQLSQDRTKVQVTVNLDKSATSFATDGSRFWVVRPRIGLGGISGLGTLLSGSYIGADTGGPNKRKDHFEGLEKPPPLTHNESGQVFLLASKDLGSLDIGSPVYYRHIQVGRVVAYHLNKDGQGVTVQVFVEAPNDKYVTKGTRFWNASGVNVSLNANGLTVNTESLATVVSGGVAFRSPPDSQNTTLAPADTHFTLFSDKTSAMQPRDGPPLVLTMRFRQSVRGLDIGASIDFLGIDLGKVTAISLDYDPKAKRFPADVTAVIYPQRIGKANERFMQKTGDTKPGALLKILINHGMRAQLRNGNLLTGQLYVALDFFPKAPKVTYDSTLDPLEVPTVTGSFDKLQQQVADIVDKIHKIPFGQIGQHADKDLKQIHTLLSQFNQDLMPEAHATLQQAQKALDNAGQAFAGDSPLTQNLGQTMVQLQRAARSLRVLTSYLSRHPEALLRGRRDNAAQPEALSPSKPAPPSAPTHPPASTHGSKP